MFTLALFGISVLFSLITWTILARQFIWPVLRDRTRADALRPILMLHSFRFVGLSFLIPGVVSPNLPWSFAGPAAYGDLATAILALLALQRCAQVQAQLWFGHLICGGPPIYFTRSTLQVVSASSRALWAPHTSFLSFWCRCFSSPTHLYSVSYCDRQRCGTSRPPGAAPNIQHSAMACEVERAHTLARGVLSKDGIAMPTRHE
jgi:hypothetical protein